MNIFSFKLGPPFLFMYTILCVGQYYMGLSIFRQAKIFTLITCDLFSIQKVRSFPIFIQPKINILTMKKAISTGRCEINRKQLRDFILNFSCYIVMTCAAHEAHKINGKRDRFSSVIAT